jgi:flagellar biogenesis protein FliO
MLKLVALAAVFALPLPLIAEGPDPSADAPATTPTTAPAASPPATPAVSPTRTASPNDSKPLFPAGFKAPDPGAPKAPQKPADTTGFGALTATAVPLAIVIGVILIASFLFRRAVKSGGSLAASLGGGGRAPAGLLEVLGRYPIARGQTLVLLKVDQRVLLLSQTSSSRGNAGGFTTLSEITDPSDVASILAKVGESEATGPASRFNALLADANGEHETPRSTGFRRLASMINPQPVSWQEPEPPSPTQPDATEPTAPTMRFTGVDSLRSRIAAMKTTVGGER